MSVVHGAIRVVDKKPNTQLTLYYFYQYGMTSALKVGRSMSCFTGVKLITGRSMNQALMSS